MTRSLVPLWSTRAIAAMLIVIVGWMLVGAQDANAHAVLTNADPQDQSRIDDAPGSVTLTFNEPVEVTTDGVRVFDADAQRIDEGMVETDSATIIEVALPDDVPDGGYVVVYRVTSADSHPVGGVTTFTLGNAREVADEVVAELFGGSGIGVTGWVGPALRGLGYVATLLAIGAFAFAAMVARRQSDQDLARLVGVKAAWASVVFAVAAMPVQAAAVTGGSFASAFSPAALAEVVGSSFGLASVVRVTAMVALALLWREGTKPAASAVAAMLAVGSFVLDGHQQSVEPTWLLIASDLVHVTAAAIWLGGLILLVGALRQRTQDDGPIEAAALVSRFSRLALWSVVAIAVGGLALAVPLVGSFGALVSTTYGWLLMAKTAAVGVVVLVAAYNRFRLVPAIGASVAPTGGSVDTAPVEMSEQHADGDAWKRLHTTVRVEAGIIIAVALLTGALSTTQPAVDANVEYAEATGYLDDGLEVEFIVDPGITGENALHVYVFDEFLGRPSTEVATLDLELTYEPEGIGPIPVEIYSVGPGHWTATIDDMTFAGQWRADVSASIDRFSEMSTSLNIEVADS